MMLTIWAGVGYYSVIFLAGLQNIPEELYDAARIDGCNDFQKHWHVSLPGLRPQIVFVAVISSLAALKVFDEIYVLTNQSGGILDSGVTMVFYLWKQAFQLEQRRATRRPSRSSCSAITLAFSVVNVRLLERGDGAARMSQRSDDPAGRAGRGQPGARTGAADRASSVANGLWYVAPDGSSPSSRSSRSCGCCSTSLKGPLDPVTSVPPQFIPSDPTLANYAQGPRRAADPAVLLQQRRSSRWPSGRSTCSSPRWPPTRWPRCGSPAATRSSTCCWRRSSCRPSSPTSRASSWRSTSSTTTTRCPR